MKAIWNDTVLAESDSTIIIEGNHYFPPESIHQGYFKNSNYSTTCPWKGKASYYTIEVNGDKNENAAWSYPRASELAKNIEGRIAFWKGVKVVD